MLPLFLAATFLLRQVFPLIVFTGILFSVKVWTLIWVVLDKTSTVWFGIYTKTGGSLMWEAPLVNTFIALGAVILPLVMSAAVIFFSGRMSGQAKL
jgi:hypothetical protein